MDLSTAMVTADENTDNPIIPVGHMPQQVHVWDAADDWTGVTDRKERRKLQNRQNQRKWRKPSPHLRPACTSHATSTPRINNKKYAGERRKAKRAPSPSRTVSSESLGTSSSAVHEYGELRCAHASPNALEYLRWFEATARESYALGSPKSEHLIGIQRLNVHRAISENIRAIGMTLEWTNCDDSLSIFNLSPPGFTVDGIPLSLRPTEIQRTIPHHPWLDFFPFPKMRDCLITAAHLFDDNELCHDLMAFWDTRNTGATLLVWGQSWDPRNWEVTEGFVRKWSWLLRDSPELWISTNYWRRRRGEKALVWREVLALE
jgi:hypothetical protein